MPFQPGQSGNPEGSRVDKIWRDAIRKELIDAEREDKPYSARKLARVLLSKAADGDIQALKEVGDRTDGKPAQAVTLANEDGQDFRVLQKVERVIVDPKA